MFKTNKSLKFREITPAKSYPDLPLNQWIQSFSNLLITSNQEELQINKEGHSFTTLVKDIYRIIHRDFIQNGFSIEEVYSIFKLWDKEPIAISKFLNLDEVKSYHLNQIYYGAKEYLYKQLETLVGETLIVESPDKIQNHDLEEFVKENKLKKRIFSYSLTPNEMYQMIMGAYNSLKVRNNEREFVELKNLVKIFLGNKHIDDRFKETLIAELDKVEIDVYQIIEFPIQSEDFIVEVSPPYENYSFQKEVMLRTYSIGATETSVAQLVIPKNNLDQVLKYIEDLNGKNQSEFLSNQILSNLIFARTDDLKLNTLGNILNLSIQQNLELLRQNDKILESVSKDIEENLKPFAYSFFSQLNVIHTESNFKTAVDNLNDFMFHLISKYDARFEEKDEKLKKEIRNGKYLRDFSNDITQKSSAAPALGGSYAGGCNSLSSSGAGAKPSTSDMKGASTQIVSGKNGETLTFKTVKNDKGEEEKYILCPVCNKGYFDVCNLDAKCEFCHNKGTEVYQNYESGTLGNLRSKYDSEKAGPAENHTHKSQKSESAGPSIAGKFGLGVMSVIENSLNSFLGLES